MVGIFRVSHVSTDSGRSAKGQAKKLLISSHHWVHCRKQLFENEKCCYSAYFPLLTAQEFLVAILGFPLFFFTLPFIFVGIFVVFKTRLMTVRNYR